MADSASLVVRVKSEGVSQTDRQLGGLTKTAMAVGTAIGTMTAAAITAGAVFAGQSVQANRRFEKSLSDLSAITGSTGKQLEYLKAQSLEIGATTSLSASQASEAFKLIASAKPDLLESASALNEVTKAAVTLAEAAGTDLPTAADTLGSSLNQFSADASEANRFINVLAAGAKFGASEINDTAIALKNSGVAAKSVGVGFEEANAAIQALAAVGIKGGEAGTGLRNILLKLESDTNSKFKPSVNGLVGALENLAAMQEDTTQLTKRFGLENVTTAQALVGNVRAVSDLRDKLTGTNTALEQSKTRTNNLDGDIKILSSSVEALSLAIGEKLNPAMRASVQLSATSATEWAKYIDSLGSSPDTIDGVRLRLQGINEQLAETQAREKRFGSNGFMDALFGGAGDKVAQVKALQEESQKLIDKLKVLQGDTGQPETITTPVTSAPPKPPETTAEGQAQIEALKMRAELYRVNGVEREKLSAIQSLGAGATDKEKVKAAELAAEIYNLNEAESKRIENGRLMASQSEQATAYLEQLRQSNLSEKELIEVQQRDKAQILADFYTKGIIDAQEYQDGLTEIMTSAVLSRASLETQILDEQSKAKEEIRKGELARVKEESRIREKQIDDGIDAQRNMTANLKSALGEQSSLYKASAIVTATIDTYKAATGAYAAMASIPYVGPVLGGIAAGAAVVAGLANVAAIRGAREQGGSMVGGGAYQMAERGKAEVIMPAGASRARTAAQMRDIMGQNGSGASNVTIVNNTAGRVDNVQTEQRDDGMLMITIEENIINQMLDPDSRMSKARRSTANQAGF